MSNIIDKIQVSGVTYTLSAETSGGGITSGEVQTMIDTSISGKVNVSDNEVPPYYKTYKTGYWPESRNPTSYWSGGDTVKCQTNIFGSSNYGQKITIQVKDSSDNAYSGTSQVMSNKNHKTDPSYFLPSGMGDYLDVTFNIPETEWNTYKVRYIVYTAKEGYKITYAEDFKGYDGSYYTAANIVAVGSNQIFEGGQSAYVIENAIEPKIETISDSLSAKTDTSAFTAYSASVETALSGKQDTLSAGTNITISGNVISAEGGGKAIEAGRGISITTGATADTVSLGVPISAGTGTNSIIEGSNTSATGNNSHAEGYYTHANGRYSHAEGQSTFANESASHAEGSNSRANGRYSHAEGNTAIASGHYSHAEGYNTETKNQSEHASGQFNVSNSATTTFGDSGNTLFSVGNGNIDASHNAFEIRQNGDIYLSSGGTDIKLQDHLGGGGSSYTAGDGIDITNDVISVTGKADTSAVTEVSDALTAHTADATIHVTSTEKAAWNAKSDFSGDYNDLANKPTIPTVPTSNTAFTNDAGYITIDAISGKVDTSTYNTYTAATDTALASKQTTLTAGTNITIVDNVISAEGGGKVVTGGTNISVTTGETADTINCTLPIYINPYAGRGDINIGRDNNANYDYYRIAIGNRIEMSSTQGGGSIAIGVADNSSVNKNKCYGGSNVAIGRIFQIGESNSYSGARHGCVVIGNNAKSLINSGVAIGSQTTVSGTTKTNINNQLTIDTSNQVYISNSANTSTYCLQEKIENTEVALGGLKLVKLSQSEYDALATKDSNTLYVIVN